jgi:hypothetical protein
MARTRDVEVEEQAVEPTTEFTESEWEHMNLRRGQGDAALLFNAIAHTGGTITIVPDPAPEEPQPVAEETKE